MNISIKLYHSFWTKSALDEVSYGNGTNKRRLKVQNLKETLK